MNDKHEREELQQALELDALLDTWQAGRSAAAHGEAKLSSQDTAFARQLVQLAQTTEPEPDFVVRLENQLRWAARQGAAASRREAAPPRRMFWQELMDAFTGRRVLLTAGALAIVAALVIIVWPLLDAPGTNNTGDDTRIAVAPTDAATPFGDLSTGTDMAEEDNVGTLGVPETTPISPDVPPTETREAIAAITPTPDLASLPKLPTMNGSGMLGMGGGGGGSGGAADSMPLFENRLENAQFNLSTTLPDAPASGTVYHYQQTDPSIERVREIAARFGFTGGIYYDAWYDKALENPEIGWPGPRTYSMFDGALFFNVIGNSFSYFDNSVITPGSFLQPMPYEQGVPIALDWATERGFLDFPYEMVKSPFGEEVAFYRVINGWRHTLPELSVSVMENGQVLSAYYLPFDVYTAVGDYPLLSAEAAWQLAQTEPDYQTVSVSLYPDPTTVLPVPTPDPRYRSWYRLYQDGDPIALYAYPQVFLPVTEGEPVVLRTNEFFLTGDQALLDQIAAATDQNLRITGTIVGDTVYAQSILVSGFELVDPIQEWQSREGFIRRAEDGQVFLDTTQGETILIPNAPDDLGDGEHVGVSGPIIEPGDPYPVFDWTSMDRVVEFEFIPEEEFIFPTPVPITQVNIDRVELIYYYTFVNDPEFDGPGQDWFQLAWRFSGVTDTGELVEITVQAAAPEFVQPAPTPMP
jgi:hypothetical protein